METLDRSLKISEVLNTGKNKFYGYCIDLFMMAMLYLFMSHDVDWPRHGPSISHIMARKDRFDSDIIKKVLVEGYNPYYNIPEIMEAEERVGVRSTFFFRPTYDDGSTVIVYEDDIKSLVNGGWEIGVHLNNADNIEDILRQKHAIESIARVKCLGSRVHYLKVNEEGLLNIYKAGFLYDSSLVFIKSDISTRNMGCLLKRGLVVFPITLMDAYIFTYMKVDEGKVLNIIKKMINTALAVNIKIITILWHVGSVKMRGGRMYFKVLEYLASCDDISIVKGIEAFNIALEEGLCREA